MDRLAVEVGELDARGSEDGHVAVGEEVDIARVMENAGHVGRDKRFAFAYADNDRRPGARGNDLVGLGSREDAKGKRTAQALHGKAQGRFEREGSARRCRIFLNLFDEVGDDLGVGLGDEDVTLPGEFALEVEVVFDDAVVDDHDAARAVAMGVGVFFRRPAVGSPACVADAEGALHGILAEDFFKVGQLAGGAAHFEGWTRRIADGNARRVVATIFEPPQAFDDDRNDFLWSNIANNAAHRMIVGVCFRFQGSGVRGQGSGVRDVLSEERARSGDEARGSGSM